MRTLASLLRWRALRHPDLPITWFQGRSRMFAEMNASSSALAGGLVEKLGVRPGDRIAILDKNSDAYVELMLAIAKAGGISVPVNWRLTPSEVATIVTDAQPTALVVGEGFDASASQVGCPVLGFGELPRGGDDPARDTEEAVLWQLYTSGTTGLPKGALLTNQAFISGSAGAIYEFSELEQGGRGLVAMPLYYIGGCGWLAYVVGSRACAVMVREVNPPELLQVMVEQRVQTGFLVPAVLLFLTQLPQSQNADFSALKSIVYGASPISQDLLKRSIETFACRFTQVYGLTETSGAITALQHEHHEGERLLSCGRPMFGAEMRIVDPLGSPVPDGVISL